MVGTVLVFAFVFVFVFVLFGVEGVADAKIEFNKLVALELELEVVEVCCTNVGD